MRVFVASLALAAVATTGTATAEPFKMPSFVSTGPKGGAQWYNEIGKAIMDGSQLLIMDLLADDVKVVTKDARGDYRNNVVIRDGRGKAEASSQIGDALEKLGKPASYQCRPEKYELYFCSFEFPEKGRFMLVFLTQKQGKVDSIEFDVSLPAAKAVVATPAPVIVPPALAAIDRPVVDAFVKDLAAGKISSAAQMVRPEAMVARAVRDPFKDETVTKSQGKGPAAAEAEAKLIVSELGQPKSVECEYQTSYAICAFKFAPGTGMWIVGLSTQDGQIGHVHYIYATRQMILDMQRAAM